MPELRKDPIVGRWVIISTDRAKRPTDFVRENMKIKGGFCPFCYGNEGKTPPEIQAYRPNSNGGPTPQRDTPGWTVRVVPNKFPALGIEGNMNRQAEGMFDRMNGIGAHEVIIETPDHTASLATLPPKRIEDVLWTFRDRILDLKKDRRFNGGMTAFTVAFLKTEAGMSESKILLVTSFAFLGGLGSLWFLGSRLDHLGSKPVLTFCFCAWVAVLAGWICLSGRVLPMQLSSVLILQALMGLLAALVQMSNTRLAMAVIPVMGRNHFFAIYSVVANVTLGLAPIAWGLLIDAVGARAPIWLGIAWTRYTVFFAAASCVYLVTLVFARRLDEPQAASMDALLREILIQSPQRFWFRFWPRGGA